MAKTMIMICFVFIVFGVLEIKSNGQRIDTGTRIHTHVYAALAFGIYPGIAGEGKHVLHHERCVERAPLHNLPEVVRQLHVVHLQERGVLDIEVALILPFPEVCIQIAGVEAVELVAVVRHCFPGSRVHGHSVVEVIADTGTERWLQ